MLEGKVLDDAARPVPNARIAVRGAIVRAAQTDATGTFRVAGLVAGTYQVAATADGYVRAEASPLVPHEGKAEVTMRLVRGITVSGVVRASTGQPVAGARVSSSAWNLGDPRLDVETDARGEFRLGPLPTGSVRLSAFAAAHGVSEIVDVALTPRDRQGRGGGCGQGRRHDRARLGGSGRRPCGRA